MVEIILWLAIASGLAGVLARNRTAPALLASVALCLTLEHLRIQFTPTLWLLIDAAVIWWISSRRMTGRDIIVMSLFIPAWASYLMPDPTRYVLAFTAVAAQLFVMFPLENIQHWIWRKRKMRQGRGRTDNLVVA